MKFPTQFASARNPATPGMGAILALLAMISVAQAECHCGKAATTTGSSKVQLCSCSLFGNLWSGYRGECDADCDTCEASCGCEASCDCEPDCGCEEPQCGCEEPQCGCEPVCDDACDSQSGGLKCCGTGLFAKLKAKLKPKPKKCETAPTACGCGNCNSSQRAPAAMHHRNIPSPMPVPPAPMIVEPVDASPAMDVIPVPKPTPHHHLQPPTSDSVNDPFRDDAVRIRRTAVPMRHAPVNFLEPVDSRKTGSQRLRTATFEKSANAKSYDRWSAPLYIAPTQKK